MTSDKKDKEIPQEEPKETEALSAPSEEAPEETAQDAGKEAVLALQEEHKALQDRFLRLAAEFDNYKKTVQRERMTGLKYAQERILLDLLPVLDHLEQAVEAGSQGSEHAALNNVLLGVKMVLKQFAEVLAKHDVRAYSALGKPFDPSCQEAVSEKEDSNVAPGTVIAEYQKGYFLHDRLIRPARVVVSKAPSI